MENKVKVIDIPEWNGHDNTLVPWLFDINAIAIQSYEVWTGIGAVIPRRFTKVAQEWWRSKPGREQITLATSWTTLRLAICKHWMDRDWRDDYRMMAQGIRYQDASHSREYPIMFFYRKKLAIQVSEPGYDESTIINAILEAAPTIWRQFLRPKDLRTLSKLEAAIKTNTRLIRKSEVDSNMLESLAQEVKNLKSRNDHSSKSSSSNNTSRYSSAKTHTTNPEEQEEDVYSHFLSNGDVKAKNTTGRPPYPYPLDSFVTTKGLSPSKKKAPEGKKKYTPCSWCGGDYWDYECPRPPRQRNPRTARANMVEAASDSEQEEEESKATESVRAYHTRLEEPTSGNESGLDQ